MATGHILFLFYAFLSSFIFDLFFSCLESDVPRVQSRVEVLDMSAVKVVFPASVELMNIREKRPGWRLTHIRYRIPECSNGFGSLADKTINIGVYRVSEKGQGQRREGKKMKDGEIKRGNESSRFFN